MKHYIVLVILQKGTWFEARAKDMGTGETILNSSPHSIESLELGVVGQQVVGTGDFKWHTYISYLWLRHLTTLGLGNANQNGTD